MQNIIGFDPGISVFWIWLNFTGFFFTVAIAYLISSVSPAQLKDEAKLMRPQFKLSDFLCKECYLLFGFFVFILILCAYLPQMLS